MISGGARLHLILFWGFSYLLLAKTRRRPSISCFWWVLKVEVSIFSSSVQQSQKMGRCYAEQATMLCIEVAWGSGECCLKCHWRDTYHPRFAYPWRKAVSIQRGQGCFINLLLPSNWGVEAKCFNTEFFIMVRHGWRLEPESLQSTSNI